MYITEFVEDDDMHTLKEKVSIIIPAYNEAHHIVENLKEIIKTFDDFGCKYEIIVVDDGSTDDTFKVTQNFSKKYSHVHVRRNLKNYGKGRALKKGVRFAKGEYIILIDADMDLHPGQIQTFFDIMRLDESDVVIGSKMHPNSVVSYPFNRKIISKVYFFFIKILFGLPIKDTQTGLKLFKTKVIKKAFPKILVKQFAYDLELLVVIHRMGYKIAEAPVVLDSKREFGRIGCHGIYVTWWDTMAVWYRTYVLRWYD